MLSVMHNINNATLKENMAAFDYDWTLVNPKDGKTFPTSIDDWVWMYPNIAKKIKEYYNNDYMIVIVTNQSKEWKCEQIINVMKQLEIPLFVIIAREKNEYKPNTNLFNKCINNNMHVLYNKEINKDKSFFVGDALGRKTDFSDSDKVFAENIGIKWFSPEEFFDQKKKDFEIPHIPLSEKQEIIIMMGYPGSGKSSVAEKICENKNYIHIKGDIYKTSSKMKRAAIEHLKEKKSIIFDATHSSIKKRRELIEFAEKYGYEVKCIHMKTSLDESYKRNKLRCDKEQVPKIAYSVYKKYYEEPNIEEGFTLITI